MASSFISTEMSPRLDFSGGLDEPTLEALENESQTEQLCLENGN